MRSPFRRRRPDPQRVSPTAGGIPQGGIGEGRDRLQAIATNTGPAISIGGGFANSGVYVDRSVRQQAPRQPAPWPHLVGNPPGRALGFQERAHAARLREALQAEGATVVGQVLSGLGGVGKSQLAADYALTEYASGRLDVLVWITAASRQAVLDGFSRAAVELLAVEPDEQAASRFLAWLQPASSRPECRWLVVLDDLADPADLRGLWPPASPTGRTVITTRRRDAALTGPGRRRVDVGVFTPAEAAAALGKALTERGHPAQSEVQIQALAQELGFLPLAVSQAAAYISDANLDVADYRALLADRARTLADLLPRPGASGGTLPDDQDATVAATWSLSLERADRLHPQGLARPMLQLNAMLDPHGIPHTVLTSAPVLRYLAEHRARPAAHDPGRLDVDDAQAALRILYRLSLIEHAPDQPTSTVRVHELVQRVARETLTPAGRDRVAHTAADALLAAWPGSESDTALIQALRANTAALDRVAGPTLYTPGVHEVLVRAGTSLGDAGLAAAARDHFDRLHERMVELLGRDHPHTLTIRGNYAIYRGEAGDFAGAAAAFRELLPRQARVLGPDHLYTLTTRDHLAGFQGRSGDPVGALAAFQELLADEIRALGPDDPLTLATRNNLALFMGKLGDADGAVAAFETLLADRTRVLGPDHPDTLTTRENLATFRTETGDTADTEAALTRLLADRTRVLGPDHPDTLTARSRLASFRGEAGDADGAVAAFETLLADRTRVLGPDHPDTLGTRDNLARFRAENGDAAGAVLAYEELLADEIRILGPAHPGTLTTHSNLAHFREQAGDADGAMDAYEELLPRKLLVLGPDHPDTLATYNNLACLWGRADPAGAAAALEELLADHIRVLGPDHPDTLTTRDNLAHFRGQAGDAASAATAYQELLADRIRVLGPDHPHTLATRDSLAYWLKSAAR